MNPDPERRAFLRTAGALAVASALPGAANAATPTAATAAAFRHVSFADASRLMH